MKKFLLFSLIMSYQMIFSQVSLEKNKLVKDGVQYKFSKHEDVLQNQDAQMYFKKARTNKTVGEVFAYAGGFGLGLGIAQALQSENKTTNINGVSQTVKMEKAKGSWAFIGAGVALIGIGIPFALAANKNAKRAIEIENGESTAFQPYFKLESGGNGLALSYNF